MDQVRTIGLDIAKNVFQVHGVDESGAVVLRRQVRRRQVLEVFGKLPPCLVGIEACATAQHWARELTKLGHEVRLVDADNVIILDVEASRAIRAAGVGAARTMIDRTGELFGLKSRRLAGDSADGSAPMLA